MAGIVEKFIKLKTSIGGNREKTGYEDTFGMPKEEQAYVTRPNKANTRIISELEFALHLSEGKKAALTLSWSRRWISCWRGWTPRAS